MFIKNTESGMIHECSNEDVIASCIKDKRYQVAETYEELSGEVAETQAVIEQNEPESEEKEMDEEIINDDNKTDSEASEEVVGTDYASMKVDDLRKLAKKMGIQGYGNMNKDTLVEVIKAHE